MEHKEMRISNSEIKTIKKVSRQIQRILLVNGQVIDKSKITDLEMRLFWLARYFWLEGLLYGKRNKK